MTVRRRVHSLAGRRGRQGVAALELALIIPVLAPLVLGVADFSMAYHTQLQLSSTLAAGAEYAFTKGQSGENGTALDNDVTGFVNGIAPTPLNALQVTYNNGDSSATDCYCVNGTGPTYTATACGSACTDGSGSTGGKYVAISGTASYSPIFAVYGIVFPTTFTQSVTVRLQ